MAESFEQKLLSAIMADDLKAFDAMNESAQLGSCKLGRFPVLSLLYLYGSRKILAAYEERFLKITTWQSFAEPASVSMTFAKRAGKCLRLYFDEVVTPIEMLLILDKTAKVKAAYPIARPSEAIRGRLKKIYDIKYAKGVTFRGRGIELERRPLNKREKKRLALAVVSCVLAVVIIASSIVAAALLLPNRAKGEVTKLSQIDFSARKTYVLKRDIVVPAEFTAEEIYCTIRGGKGRLIMQKGATLGTLMGTFENLEIFTEGSPIFKVCTNLGNIKNVTVNVTADVETAENTAFVAVTNYGFIDGLTLNVSGKARALSSGDQNQETLFGGIAARNTYSVTTSNKRIFGEIKNCMVNYQDFSLEGELQANASFGGVAGENESTVQDCAVSGRIFADTFDCAGACCTNYYTVSRVENSADISQTARDEGWTSVVGGLVIENAGEIEYCKNFGKLSVQSASAAICGGICARTYFNTDYCLSSGEIEVSAQYAFVGGIFGRSEVVTQGGYVYIGIADHCVSDAKITVTANAEETSCVGGIGGLVQEGSFTQHTPEETVVYWGGGVTNCAFLGEIECAAEYTGGIVGVSGANIYAQNSYATSAGTERNFEGNYYIAGDGAAFGATVAVENEEEVFAQVSDKGATAASEETIKNTDLYKGILEELAAS